jgi:hypothetical protein
MGPVLWVVVAIATWMTLVLPLSVACGRAFAAGGASR